MGLRYFLIFSFLGFSGISKIYTNNKKEEKIEITADEMSFDDKNKITTAKGNAVIARKNKESTQTLKADTIIAKNNDSFTTKSTDPQKQFSQFCADGHVQIEADGYNLTADSCEYSDPKEEIVCNNNVHIVDPKKGTTLKGHKIKIDLKTDQYHVFSKNGEKAEVVLFPQE
ncbi:MAG: Lipopolysaccharide export system protein LptA [Holosporales bacterium]